jgi:hypothetical protein
MRLSINNHFLNTTYSTEDGQALYKVQTPMAWRKSSAISKLLPDNIPSSSGEPEARYGHLASIPWTAVGYCYIRMTGGDIDTRTFFHKKSRLAR